MDLRTACAGKCSVRGWRRGLSNCARCGERILEGEPWDLGHDDYDRRLYLGPEHRRCNRSAAGRKSIELQRCKTSREW